MRKPQRWTRPLSIYSRVVVGFWGFILLGWLVFNSFQYRLFVRSWSTGCERFLIPMALVAGCYRLWRAELETRLVAANCLLALLFGLYGGEFYLAAQQERLQRRAARDEHRQYDGRDKLQVIHDLRAQHVDAYPIMRGKSMLIEDNDGVLRPALSWYDGFLLPLASIPDTTVVSCNESGEWQVYRADRHGFNNPDTVWDSAPVIGMVGDSFAHGSCVHQDQNIAAGLETRHGPTVNLGVSGAGPLLELAALVEYLEPLKPRTVLWCFFEGNDLTEDLPRERHSELLLHYLNDRGFSQDLIHRNAEIGQRLRAYLDREMRAAMNRVDKPYENILRYLTLDRVRAALGMGAVQIGYSFGDLDDQFALFEAVMTQAKRRVDTWGGRLYLVYLPESDRYLSKLGESVVRRRIHAEVGHIAERQQIPLIDISAAFAGQPAPEKLYAYPGAHFSVYGYRVAAETLAGRLRKDQRPETEISRH